MRYVRHIIRNKTSNGNTVINFNFQLNNSKPISLHLESPQF